MTEAVLLHTIIITLTSTWLIVGLAAAILEVINLTKALDDRHNVRVSGLEVAAPRRVLVEAMVRRSLHRLASVLFFTAAGFAAVLLPVDGSQSAALTLRAITTPSLLTGGLVALALNSVAVFWEYVALDKAIEHDTIDSQREVNHEPSGT